MRVIVLLIRGCPAGWLGPYGNEWVVTPNLDRLATESVVFDRHISDRPDPDAADRALLGLGSPDDLLGDLRRLGVPSVLVRANHPDTDRPTGFYDGWAEVFDARPQAEDDSPLDALLRDLPGLLTRLVDRPAFLLWIEIDRLLPPWEIAQPVFEAYFLEEDDDSEDDTADHAEPDAKLEEDDDDTTDGDDDTESQEPGENHDDKDHDDSQQRDAGNHDGKNDDHPSAIAGTPRGGPSTGAKASPEPRSETSATADSAPVVGPALGKCGPVPAAARLAGIIPPWRDPPTGPFDSTDPDAVAWLQASFAAVVTSLDVELGRLMEQLRQHRLDESAAWLLTSDFGYPLGEHGQIGCYRPWLHEELVHLPLILRLPNAAEAGRRVYGFTQPPDVGATLRELFVLPAGSGRSLLPLARGDVESIRRQAVTVLEYDGAAEAAIRTDDRALLVPLRVPECEDRRPMLFEKPEDRWEVNDLAARHVEQVEELTAELRRVLGIADRPGADPTPTPPPDGDSSDDGSSPHDGSSSHDDSCGRS